MLFGCSVRLTQAKWNHSVEHYKDKETRDDHKQPKLDIVRSSLPSTPEEDHAASPAAAPKEDAALTPRLRRAHVYGCSAPLLYTHHCVIYPPRSPVESTRCIYSALARNHASAISDVFVVAGDHLAVGNLVTQAVSGLVRINRPNESEKGRTAKQTTPVSTQKDAHGKAGARQTERHRARRTAGTIGPSTKSGIKFE